MPAAATHEDKLARERAFHDDYFGDPARGRGNGAYAICRYSEARFAARLTELCRGKEVLQYGCGRGSTALELARRGARVTGIDLSGVAIGRAEDLARREGLDAAFRVMDAEELGFPDASFDVICGEGILHHLDLERAYREIARVLRPGGVAVFAEPLAHNPVINLYRRLTPGIRTRDEHPLTTADLELTRRYFAQVEVEYFHLQSLAAIPFRKLPVFDPMLRLLDAADRHLFAALPPVRKYAWQVVLELCGPSLT